MSNEKAVRFYFKCEGQWLNKTCRDIEHAYKVLERKGAGAQPLVRGA